MNIVFMGTPDFARESLKAIYETGHNIIGVVTNVDKPRGRGMKLQPSEVKEYAVEKGLKVYQPEKIKKNPTFIEEMESLKPDAICVVAYGKLLPKKILSIPKYGCINVHGSLLPKYRGAAPIQWAVLNGEKVTGVTTMYMDVGMDTGDIILKEEVTIGENETTGELWDKLAKKGGELLVKTLEQIEKGTAPREKQGDDFSIAPMLSKEMAKIDWENQSAEEINNLVRGLNPIMGAYTFLKRKKVKFWKVQVATEDEIMAESMDFFRNGMVIVSDPKDGIFIKTKEGILKVLEIQGENARRMSIQDFLRGNNIEEFEVFE